MDPAKATNPRYVSEKAKELSEKISTKIGRLKIENLTYHREGRCIAVVNTVQDANILSQAELEVSDCERAVMFRKREDFGFLITIKCDPVITDEALTEKLAPFVEEFISVKHATMEQCTKLFFHLEKQKLSKQLITEIDSPNGITKNDTDSITEEFRNFYKKLYKNILNDSKAQDFLFQNAEVKQVTREESNFLTKAITVNEVKKAISEMKNNKSPGSDCLTVDFYKSFASMISKELTDALNNVLSTKEMTATQKEAIISCIYEKGDKKDISNWRPISHTNVDYKILTKFLSGRFLDILPKIIHENQTACIKNRTIYNNLSYTRDIIDIANAEKLEACILSIDQVKAFDRVDREFLFKSLQHFGFEELFISHVKTLYNGISAKVKVNGNLSEKIEIQRGVRQGCPLSMILYIIQADIFSSYIRQNKAITGIKLGNKETKIQQYADDTNFYLTGDSSVKSVGDALQINNRATGAKINLANCQGIWLCKNRLEDKEKLLHFNWDHNSFISLGIFFCNSGNFYYETNWDEYVKKLEKTMSQWGRRKLSL